LLNAGAEPYLTFKFGDLDVLSAASDFVRDYKNVQEEK